MLHFLPDCESASAPEPYAEAVARLAGIRHVLRLVEPDAAAPSNDLDDDEAIGMAWEEASQSRKRCFDCRSGRVIAATAAGLEALLAEREEGREPHGAASRRIAEEIRAGLEDVSRLMLGKPAARPLFALPDALPVAL